MTGETERIQHVSLRSLTVWTAGGRRRFERSEVHPTSPSAGEIIQAARSGPVWLQLEVDSDVQEWLNPWDAPTAQCVDWSALHDVADLLGFGLPGQVGAPAPHSSTSVLSSLRYINEFGVLRSVVDEARARETAPLVAPLAGFIPTETLRPATSCQADAVEFVLVRVNIAVVDNRLISLRLTDRLCSGSRCGDSDRRRVAAADLFSRPKLTVFQRFLPPHGSPKAEDLGEALAGYLAATCGSAAEYARQHLRDAERQLLAVPTTYDAAEGAATRTMDAAYQKLLHIRGALHSAEEELVRILQRLSDVEDIGGSRLMRLQARYKEGLVELRSVEAELRRAGDAAANRIASSALQQQRGAEHRAKAAQARAEQLAKAAQTRAEQRQKKLETVVAGLGTALVIAALVPSLFGESVKLPTTKDWDFVGMVLIMLGAAGLVFWALTTLLTEREAADSDAPAPARRRRPRWWTLVTNTAAALIIVAGVVVLLSLG
jgi:hypothetical protein